VVLDAKTAIVERFRIVIRSDFKWAGLVLAGVGVLFGVAVLVGLVLGTLAFPWGAAFAFIVVVLVGAAVVLELPRLWARLPR
jgi:hypothetical protein